MKSLAIFAGVGLLTEPPARGDAKYYFEEGTEVIVTVSPSEGYRYDFVYIGNADTKTVVLSSDSEIHLIMNYNYRLTFYGSEIEVPPVVPPIQPYNPWLLFLIPVGTLFFLSILNSKS